MTASPRRPLIAGNWKLHKTLEQSRELVIALAAGVSETTAAEVVVAPVFTALATVSQAAEGTVIQTSAQDCYWEAEGAFTGEVAPALLRDAGCTSVIIGHSERRQLFGETDQEVNRKARAALAASLRPIICVGETLQEREAGCTKSRVESQIRGALEDMDKQELSSVVIAYEPIWAIGTGKTASPADAQEIHRLIRDLLSEIGGADVASSTRILYGGSVKPANAADLMSQPDVDGALVGGASLQADSFLAIINAAGH